MPSVSARPALSIEVVAQEAPIKLAAPEAPTKPVEAPVEVPSRQDPQPGEPDKQDDPDIDEQIKRIIREIPDPTPQPGGQ